MFSSKKDALLEQIISVIEQCSAGYLEPRVVNIDTKNRYAPLAHKLNDLLDQVEVWQREISSSINVAFLGKTYKNVDTKGLRGRFKDTGNAMSKAIIDIAKSVEAQKLNELSVKIQQNKKDSNIIDILSEELSINKDNLEHILQSSQNISNDASTTQEKVEELARSSAKLQEYMNLFGGLINTLNEKTSEISNILEMVKDITEQTQLLSLNAAIEAARAGEHGRGFAVVADEVRKLANNTEDATNTIGTNISSLKESVSKCLEYSENIIKISDENSKQTDEFYKTLSLYKQLASENLNDAKQTTNLQNNLFVQMYLLFYKNNAIECLLNKNLEQNNELKEHILSMIDEKLKGDFEEILNIYDDLYNSVNIDEQTALANKYEDKILALTKKLS